jgi:hypothetical protein
MALVVGTDTYITLAEADDYITNNYPSTSTEFTTWDALSDSDKELYLKKSTRKIDRQIIRGVKAVSTQVLEFPRAIKTEYLRDDFPLLNIYFDSDWVVETEVNQLVKDAEVEEALGLVVNGTEFNNRANLQRQGVKSFTLGKLSESYDGSYANSQTKLSSVEASELLRYYVVSSAGII